MNSKPLITCFAFCAMSIALADDPAPKPECALDVPVAINEPIKIVTEPIPKKYAQEKAVAIKLENLERHDSGNYSITFRIINPTKEQIAYTGYSETSPITTMQCWVDGQWVEQKSELFCGTGLNDRFLPSGESAVFKSVIPGDKLPARIGISHCLPDDKPRSYQFVWSDKIER